MSNKVKILCFDDALEAITIRSVLESFDAKVEIAYIGRPNAFIEELNNSDDYKYIILSGHGDNKFIMPVLAEDIYEEDEPKDITSEVIKEKININNKIIISICCNTGTTNIAESFIQKENTYIAPSDFIEGTAALFFVIKFFYEHFVLKKSIVDSYNNSMINDNETRLYKLFS